MAQFISNLIELSEIEKVRQLERMNAYPPFAYKFANILEKRQESVLIYKLQDNFFNSLDTSRFGNNPINLLVFGLFSLIIIVLAVKYGHQ